MKLNRVILLAAAFALFFWIASSSAAVGEPNGKTNQITIDNFSYSPAELKVAPGTTVTWTNHDDVPHTVTENNFKFKSPALDTDEAFSHKFETPGTYEYFCSLHPRMVARIIVSK